MTSKEIILSIIENDDRFKTARLNETTKKIEIEGEDIMNVDYSDLYELCVEKYPDTKFTKSSVRDLLQKYARDNKYKPKAKKKSEWYSKLDFDDKEKPIKNLQNAVKFFDNYPEYTGKLAYNEFTQYETYDGELIKDYTINEFRLKMEENLDFDSRDKVEAAINLLAHRSSFNPFKEAIEDIVWDGENRLDTFFIDTIGAIDNKLNRSMTRKWFYALMNRLYKPGCSFDNMLITYDPTQGTGKSKVVENLVECLGLSYGYSTSITCDNKDKDNIDKLNKTWIVGIDEMNEFLKKTPEQTKQFIAQRTDQARLSYAKRSEVYKRHCVFYGSSNIEFFLKDYTSVFERRYWILDCSGERHNEQWWNENFPMEYFRQVLAEAKWFYDENEDFNYSTLSLDEIEELTQVQYKHKTLNNDDILQDKIFEILNKKYNKNVFDTYEDFLSYANGSGYNTTNLNDNIFVLCNKENEDNYKCIDTIPTKWLKKYVIEELHRDLSTQYLTALLSKDGAFKSMTKWYNKQTTNCYVRQYK